jgi:Zn-finger nucleic acid-binding protein
MTATVIPQNRTVLYEGFIHVIECWNCSIDFGIGDSFMANRRKDGRVFYCPNGHGNYYNRGKTAEQVALERAQAERDAARSLAQRESRRARTAEYQRRAAKGQLTKTKKRIAAGVCPCCNRTFQNVAAHMAGQHPDYVDGGDQ